MYDTSTIKSLHTVQACNYLYANLLLGEIALFLKLKHDNIKTLCDHTPTKSLYVCGGRDTTVDSLSFGNGKVRLGGKGRTVCLTL